MSKYFKTRRRWKFSMIRFREPQLQLTKCSLKSLSNLLQLDLRNKIISRLLIYNRICLRQMFLEFQDRFLVSPWLALASTTQTREIRRLSKWKQEDTPEVSSNQRPQLINNFWSSMRALQERPPIQRTPHKREESCTYLQMLRERVNF